MKILYSFGQYNYGDAVRGTSYEFTNFLPALQHMDHDVHFDVLDKSAYADFAQLNRVFLAIVEAEQPDVIFCVLLRYEFWLETFEEAR